MCLPLVRNVLDFVVGVVFLFRWVPGRFANIRVTDHILLGDKYGQLVFVFLRRLLIVLFVVSVIISCRFVTGLLPVLVFPLPFSFLVVPGRPTVGLVFSGVLGDIALLVVAQVGGFFLLVLDLMLFVFRR